MAILTEDKEIIREFIANEIQTTWTESGLVDYDTLSITHDYKITITIV